MIFIDNKYTRYYFSIIDRAKNRKINNYYEKHHIIPDCFYINRKRKGPKGTLSGDPNDSENIVKLTAREHFVCHLLLTKMVLGQQRIQMYYAIWSLINRGMHTKKENVACFNSHTYEICKHNFSEASSLLHRNKTVSNETREKLSRAKLGTTLSEQTKLKISKKLSGKKHTTDTKKKISNSNIGKHSTKGRKHSDETKRKISEGNKGKIMPPVSKETKAKISAAGIGRQHSKDHIIKRIKTRKQNGHYKNKKQTIERMKKSAAGRPKIKCSYCSGTFTPAMYKRWHGEKCKHKH